VGTGIPRCRKRLRGAGRQIAPERVRALERARHRRRQGVRAARGQLPLLASSPTSLRSRMSCRAATRSRRFAGWKLSGAAACDRRWRGACCDGSRRHL